MSIADHAAALQGMPRRSHARPLGGLFRRTRALLGLLVAVLLATVANPATAADAEPEPAPNVQYWIDTSATASIQDVARAAPSQFRALENQRTFPLGTAALWLRLDFPPLDPAHRWYVLLSGAAFVNHASLFSQQPDGRWTEQAAGDHVPVARWDHPNQTPLFEVKPGMAGPAYLRLDNQPAPASTFVQLLRDDQLANNRQWTYLLLGGYLGFGLLVIIVGFIHSRLYGDAVFDAYCVYAACMLMFQMSFTGMAGLFFWPRSSWLNDAAPAVFMLWMVGAGIWFIREATALSRHSQWMDRMVMGFCLFGVAFSVPYVLFNNATTYAVLNVYGLLSVVLSLTLCAWTWRKGEAYSGWLLLGFLPIHLSYPFPALRAAGVLADSWGTQYAVLIGSAIEIPLLLYIMHRRAQDFSENRARLRALDSTDPLTGLPIVPVLRLRLRDAVRRAQRSGHRCAVLLVELTNHAEIVEQGGREAGDRALVVAASRLSAVVRDVDTVCRVANTRFALLLEGPQPEHSRKVQAQHVVARGLEPMSALPIELTLRFRVVSACPPDGTIELSAEGAIDETLLLERMNWALDRLSEDPKKVVLHLEPRTGPAAAVQKSLASG